MIQRERPVVHQGLLRSALAESFVSNRRRSYAYFFLVAFFFGAAFLVAFFLAGAFFRAGAIEVILDAFFVFLAFFFVAILFPLLNGITNHNILWSVLNCVQLNYAYNIL